MTKTLTASNIRYLLIMQRLDPENKGTRCTDVAEKLKCSKPSVHNMMHTLRDMGIIRRDAYGESFWRSGMAATLIRWLLCWQTGFRRTLCSAVSVRSSPKCRRRRWLLWKRRSAKWKSFPVLWRSWASLSCAA